MKKLQWFSKKDPRAKNDPYAKNLPVAKRSSIKILSILEDMLNIIDFNLFNMLKLIFTCESCAISFTE